MKAEIGSLVAIANMTTTERIEHSIQQDDDFKKQVKRTNIFLLLVAFALFAGPALLGWWAARQIPAVQTLTIENLHVIGETSLCPGQPLIVGYDFHAQGSGVLVRDWSTWLVTPPKTMIFSNSRRFILDGPVDQHLTETWHVPDTYLNYETELPEPLPPGQYRRHLAISSPSRSTVIAISSVDFEIKPTEEC